jgi:hypothetical protein
MENIKIAKLCLLPLFFLPLIAGAQSLFKDGKLLLDDTGSRYLKFQFASQFWLRGGIYNPGTTIFGYSKSSGMDIGIRRARATVSGQLSERVYFFTQVGINNFNNISERKPSVFIHDAFADYAFHPSKLSIGMGLSGWSGLGRFASPAVASIMGLDAPLYQQSTNDVTDQFLRKLSIFFKGKLGKFDYRFAVAQPLAVQKSSLYNPAVTHISNFSGAPPEKQWNGYVQYQFKDQENNQNPYMVGTYHGKKSVFNVGGGIVYQKNAMWHLADNNIDTISTNLLQYNVDVFYDVPIGVDGSALNIYLAATHMDFGPGYFRNLGPNNPTNGNNNPNAINGGGYALPLFGTGNIYYLQAGYKFKQNLLGNATIMPFAFLQHLDLNGLSKSAQYYSFGCNYLINGHFSKATLAYENRPLFYKNSDVIQHLGNFVLQYQIAF